MISSILFSLILIFSILLFIRNCRKLYRNINLGKDINRSDKSNFRFKKMFRLAFGQSKMFDKPLVGILHFIVYVAFVLINIELLEIILDGVLGTHRVLAPVLGNFYNFLIAFFELLAFAVIVCVVLFWIRRNFLKIKRFLSNDLKGWPKNDANYILYIEVVLMFLFLNMNATDQVLQNANYSYYGDYGSFPISSFYFLFMITLKLLALLLLKELHGGFIY